MKKYFVAKKVVRFIVVLLIFTVLLNGFISNRYKNIYADSGVEVEKLEQFLDNFSIIPEEIKEEYYGDFRLLSIPLNEELQTYIFETSKKYDESYMFVMAIMYTESSFNTKAKYKNQTDNYYSIGLMQLNERYIKEFKVLTGIEDFDIYNLKMNIEGGIAKISALREQWIERGVTSDEDLFLAITNSYNKGFGAYKSDVSNRGFFSRDYDRKVIRNKIKLEQGGY
jgi:hypothetical protein